MRFRCVFFFLSIFICASCNYLSLEKKQNTQTTDTIVDFTRVDVSPSFNKCKNLFDDAKTNCFRNEIQKRIAISLKQHHFVTENFIDEVVFLDVFITNKGEFRFLNTSSTESLKVELPKLDSILQKSVKDLPRISPAIKRGIPVSTQYQLPIRILTKE
ncbi:hypothetical protein H3Z83_05110 [Tenacibaculum sp. S7007]|uniref:TonB C-terminal domain-containing protein n=1 Tax=Tenacibaculum pelagium TaxID=2759527 RepID=A0A839ANV1_9FLAO|nr:hypothetical protein [Tenacibaculum pelagium]MBA6155899.1 hypothetical protein [Tenacibaculum pelagium]